MKWYIIFLLILLMSCQSNESEKQAVQLNFETMGTYGMVKYIDNGNVNPDTLLLQIKEVLLDVNMGVSTYIDSSVISKTNQAGYWIEEGETKYREHFENNLFRSLEIMEETDGNFNVFIKPLVDYWGFGDYDKRNLESKDSAMVKEMVDCMQNIDRLMTDFAMCNQLDFSAIAKGYGVDVVAAVLDANQLSDYIVEIGGEVRCKGMNIDNEAWRVGIEEPNESERVVFDVVGLSNIAMATSGNYRNFHILENGQKVVHIINPRTGYPEASNLLSASIIAPDCMSADAYATACMVMGAESCFEFVLNHPELESYLIYSDKNGGLQTYVSEGFEEMLVD